MMERRRYFGLHEDLERQAAQQPDASALATADTTLTWSALRNRAAALADDLARAYGIRAGERIAIARTADADVVIAIHAAAMLGAIIVPMNTRLLPAELHRQLLRVHARLILTGEGFAEAAEFPARASSDAVDATSRAVADTAADLHFPPIQTLLFTSGTTGAPHIVPLTGANHQASVRASTANLGVQAGDRWLCALPLFHAGGLTILHRAAHDGACVELHAAFDPDAAARALRAGCTLASFVPTMLARIFEADPGLDARAVPQLRAVLLGGAAAPVALWEEVRRRELPVLGTWGMTETASQSVTVPPADALRKLGSAGLVLPGMELAILDSAGRRCSPGVRGAMHVRGAMLSPGWVDADAEWRARMHDGWFDTGDIGYQDLEGFLWVDVRRDDLIISGGENIRPAEVEDALRCHPSVKDVCVVGVDDPLWGQVAAAALVLRADIPVSALEAHCRTLLAGYKIPRRWHVLAALPLTASGKIHRARIRALIAGEESTD